MSILSGDSETGNRSRSMTRRLPWFILAGLILTLSGAFLPPVLAKLGHYQAAQVGYWMYRPLCHEKGYRSVFLFGDQRIYPLRTAATAPNILNYEMVSENGKASYRAAGEWIGNESAGYKIALCQRDLAILSTMLIFTAVYLMSRSRIQRLPIWAWIVFGCLPMAIDGGSQYIPLRFSLDGPFRESSWQLRVLTGALFGLCTAWTAIPYLNTKRVPK